MSFKKRTVSKKNSRIRADGESDEEDNTTVVKSGDQSKSAQQGFYSSGTSKKTGESNVSGGLASTVTTVFESSRELVPQSYAGNATHTTEVDTAHDRDTRAVNDRQTETKSSDIIPLKNGSKGTFGPARAPAFVRVTSRFDYQPDICKDYKETGFCGFGDSCKFLHDRGDYKSGWQLEREWESEQTKKKKRMADSIAGFGDEDNEKKEDAGVDDDENKYAIDSDEEDLPFACFICREDFTNPVMTVCGHYFCAHCAMEGTKNTGNKCPICNKQTFGVFNRAHKLLKKIASKKGTVEPGNLESSIVLDSNAINRNMATIVAPAAKRGSWEAVDS